MIVQFAIDYGMYLSTLTTQRLLAALKINYGQPDMTEAYRERERGGCQIMRCIE
jgi:hypothetical protein